MSRTSRFFVLALALAMLAGFGISRPQGTSWAATRPAASIATPMFVNGCGYGGCPAYYVASTGCDFLAFVSYAPSSSPGSVQWHVLLMSSDGPQPFVAQFQDYGRGVSPYYIGHTPYPISMWTYNFVNSLALITPCGFEQLTLIY